MKLEHVKGVLKHEFYGLGAEAQSKQGLVLDAHCKTCSPVPEVSTSPEGAELWLTATKSKEGYLE